MKNIDFGIDLGTTNSGLAHYHNGKVTILKNPVGFQEILPSVVSFRKERILVGDKAREQLLSNPENVFSSFKRKMGTSETFFIPATGKEITPVELSCLVLKELHNFSIEQKVETAVITIPASFDTIQSNATKQAGIQSGLKEVVLLQEPIAACLAYVNDGELNIEQQKRWLVYDFGGGTFDVAIVSINQRELKVTDHKGNNFLGGVDLDLKLLSEIILPKISEQTGIGEIWQRINSNEDKVYHKFGKYLLYQAEQLKKELSLKQEAWVEVDFEELNISLEVKVTRAEMDAVVAPFYKESLDLLTALVEENQLSFGDFERVIMVGGTTYIPYIRERLHADTGIIVDTSTDPTTAVIKGAAYYAGSKTSALTDTAAAVTTGAVIAEKSSLQVTLSYEPLTKDEEELIAFKTNQPFRGFYRAIRNDGGFDSGLVPFENQANVFVSILPKQINSFTLSVFTNTQEPVFSKQDISISHGFYNVNGQPLPNDICIELDAENETYLEVIFRKNEILPLKKTIYKTFSKSIAKGSDDKIVINIVEGKVGTMPGANLNIGYVQIKGTDLKDDLIRGTDVELGFTISESRDLTVSVFIQSADQEIVETFNPQFQGEPDNEKTLSEVNRGLAILKDHIQEHEGREDYLALAKLAKIREDLMDVKNQLAAAKGESMTDARYQLLEKKRRALFAIDQVSFIKDVTEEIETYQNYKTYIQRKEDKFTPAIRIDFDNVVKDEKRFLASGDKYLIRRKTDVLKRLLHTIDFEDDEWYYRVFYGLKVEDPSSFTEYDKVKKLLREGELAFEKNEPKKLRAVCLMIFGYLKDQAKAKPNFSGTGLK